MKNAAENPTPRSTWRRYFTGQRLRLFILLSVAAHVIVLTSWGVPAYVKQRRLAEREREQAALLEQQRKAAEAAIALAKTKAHKETVAEVKQQTRRAFEDLVGDLPAKQKESVWDKVSQKLAPVEDQLAKALADQRASQQDLDNAQADLNRRLVETTSAEVTASAGQAEADAFLANVQNAVLPEMVRFYSEKLGDHVGQPLHAQAEVYVNAASQGSQTSIVGLDAQRKAAGDALATLSREMDAAGNDADAGGKDRLASAAQHISACAAAADTVDTTLAKMADAIKSPAGGSAFADKIAAVRSSLVDARRSLKQASDALAAGNTDALGNALTAGALMEERLGAQWNAVNDASAQLPSAAADNARGTVGAAAATVLPPDVLTAFGKAFDEKAADRIAAALGDAFAKRLAAKNVTDPALIKSVTAQTRQMMTQRMSDEPALGAAGVAPLGEYAGRQSAGQVGDAANALISAFEQQSRPTIQTGAQAAAEDSGDDDKLVALASAKTNNETADEARDRLATVAANEKEGRASTDAISATDLNDLRAGALLRSARADTGNSADIPDDASSSADPAQDPTVDAVKQDILKSLHHDVSKLLTGKLSPDQAEKVWNSVAKDADGDVTRLAQDVLNNQVSDSELESHRMDFSKKVLGHVGAALDQTASDDVEQDLLNQLNGDAGNRMAGAFQDAVKNQVGQPLAGALKNGADAAADSANQRVSDLRSAIDAARDTAGKSAQILDTAHAKAENAVNDPKSAADTLAGQRDRLSAVAGAIGQVQKTLTDAAKAAPIHSQALSDRLADANKAFAAVTAGLANADNAAKAGDAKAFADAVATARAAIDPFRNGMQGADSALGQEADQARAQFAKAAQTATADQAGSPGITSDITTKFNTDVRKDAIPKLTDQAVNALKEKLTAAGVSPPADDSQLRQQIANALDHRLTTGNMGQTAVGEAQQHGAFDHADQAQTPPAAGDVDHAKAVANAVTGKAVENAVNSNDAANQLDDSLTHLAGPDHAIGELKDRVARMEGELRGGRGGVLADDHSDPNAPAGVSGLRKKWRSLLAGLEDGDEDVDGPGGKHKMMTGAGGTGSGGHGPGSGAGPVPLGRGHRGLPANFDEKAYRAMLAKLNGQDPNALHGALLDLHGARGLGSRADADEAIVRPAEIIVPSTQPVSSRQNDQPYKPAFKSWNDAFATIPFLNHPIALDGDLSEWKDIPAIYLHPEHRLNADPSLHVADSIPVKMAWDNHGLYFAVDMTVASGDVVKTNVAGFPNSDALEVFLDTMNNKETARARGAGQQFWFWPFGSIDDPSSPGGESIKERFSGYDFVGYSPSQLQVSARRTAKGYTLVACLPTERVRDADLGPGKILGINLVVDSGPNIYYYWSASQREATYANPKTWGDVYLAGSDGKLEIPERLTHEDGPGDPKKTVNAVVLGQPLRLRVTDRDMNLNDKVQDKVSVTVRNPRTGDSEVAILTETGADTGVFEGSVRTGLDLGEKIPGVVSAYEGETLHVTYLDQARANGARNVEVTYDVKTASPITTALGR
jgi:hypothetical protein